MSDQKKSSSDSNHHSSLKDLSSSLSNDLKALFFYHFQNALNHFWKNQNLENRYDDLIDQVFYIEEVNQSFSFYLIFSQHHIQIYHQYQANQEVDVKIVLDKKELVSLLIAELIESVNQGKSNNDGDQNKKKQPSDKLENLKIYGKVKLAKQLIALISELDFDLKPYLEFILPTPLMMILKRLPIESINQVIQSLLKQGIGTINNLKKSTDSSEDKNSPSQSLK